MRHGLENFCKSGRPSPGVRVDDPVPTTTSHPTVLNLIARRLEYDIKYWKAEGWTHWGRVCDILARGFWAGGMLDLSLLSHCAYACRRKQRARPAPFCTLNLNTFKEDYVCLTIPLYPRSPERPSCSRAHKWNNRRAGLKA
jgi:hypothetical protein